MFIHQCDLNNNHKLISIRFLCHKFFLKITNKYDVEPGALIFFTEIIDIEGLENIVEEISNSIK